MNKKIIIQYGLSEKRLAPLFIGAKKVGLDIDYFSYYAESRFLDDFPEDFNDYESLVFATIPVLLYIKKEDPNVYKNILDYDKFNNTMKEMTYSDFLINCEQEVISEKIKENKIPYLPMLNEDAKILSMSDLKGKVFDQEMFLKPNSAYKEFLGKTTLPNESFEDFLVRNKYCGKEVEVMLAPSYSIHSEYRFFVYDDNVATGSSYIVNGKYDVNYQVPEIVLNEAKRIAKLYQPTKCFTLDLCLLNNGDVKIVEYNHFSASGVYSCEMDKVFDYFKNDTQYIKNVSRIKHSYK